MNSKNNYYVYVHLKKTDGHPFYLGKGIGRRALVKSGRSRHWNNIVKKHGYEIHYFANNLSSDEAKRIERELIKTYRDAGFPLTNITSGGDGGLDCEDYTKETREKMRAAKLGKKQSPEHAIKSKLAKKGKRQPIDAVEKVISMKKKPVINSAGEVFESASFAARELSKRIGAYCSQGNISMVCRGERVEAYGFKWSYNISEKPGLITKKLHCSNGMIFNAVVEASDWVKSWRGKSSPSNITNSMASNGKAYGFSWHYEQELTE